MVLGRNGARGVIRFCLVTVLSCSLIGAAPATSFA